MSRFNCPFCDRSFKWKKERAGKQGQCPSCNEKFTIPEHAGDFDAETESQPVQARVHDSKPILESHFDDEFDSPPKEQKTSRWIQVGATLLVLALIAIRIIPRELRRAEREAKEDQALAAEVERANRELAQQSDVPANTPQQSADAVLPTQIADNRDHPSPVNLAGGADRPRTDSLKTAAANTSGQSSSGNGNKAKSLFELYEGYAVDVSGQRSFGTLGPPADFVVTMKYRINPTDDVINVHLYRVTLRFNGREEALPMGELQREGFIKTAFHLIGINHDIPNDMKAWVEKIDPSGSAKPVRVSNVVSMVRTSAMSETPPPPLEDPSLPPLKFDRELPLAMKEARAKSEREQAERDRPLRADEFDGILKQLAGTDQWKAREALQKLQKTPASAERLDEVSRAMESLFESGDVFTKIEVMKTLSVWPSDLAIKLIPLGLQDSNHFVQSESLKALKSLPKLKIPDLSHDLVNLSLEHGHENDIEPILIELGPSAEPDVLQLLDSRDDGRVELGLKVLGKIGGKASIEPIEKRIDQLDVFRRRHAEDALRDIKRRLKK